MLTKAVINCLRQKVGAENVYQEKEDLLVYGYDATPEIQGLPDVAVFPNNVDGLKAALSVCREEGLMVTPRGAATGLSGPPHQVIGKIPGVVLREMKESNWCCGMAGSFALKEIQTSRRLLERKLSHVKATGADVLITANPGCHLQLASGLRELEMKQPVLHIVELLGRSLPA